MVDVQMGNNMLKWSEIELEYKVKKSLEKKIRSIQQGERERFDVKKDDWGGKHVLNFYTN